MLKFRKCQAVLVDFSLSVTAFLLVTALFFSIYDRSSSGIYDRAEKTEIWEKSLFVSDSLAETPGLPLNWTNETVSSIGLSKSPNVISSEKTQELNQTSYQTAKGIILSGRNDLFINITTIEGKDIFSYGEIPPENRTMSSQATRIVIYDYENGTRVLGKMRVVVFS